MSNFWSDRSSWHRLWQVASNNRHVFRGVFAVKNVHAIRAAATYLEIFAPGELMTRILTLACTLLCCGLSLAHAQTRDETVVYVLLGVESGDKAYSLTGQTVLRDAPRAVHIQSVKRIDNKTIAIDMTEGIDNFVIYLKEEPECIFFIKTPSFSCGPRTEKCNISYDTLVKIDFSNAFRASLGEAFAVESLGLHGKNVGCVNADCRDFAPLGLLRTREWQGVNERHERAVEYFRTKYCQGKPY